MKQLLAFILLSGMICWFMFAPVYKHVLVMRHALLQQEVDFLLEMGANADHGYIDARMMEEAVRRLAAHGFDPGLLQFEASSTSGDPVTDPANPVLRGTGIRLQINYPYESLFAIDRLIGVTGPDGTQRMSAAGMKMSEYVPE